MEQITRKDGAYYYGNKRCCDSDEVYCLFRSDYNNRLGKNIHDRLGRLVGRKERIHGYGFVFSEEVDFDRNIIPGTIRYKIIGMLGISYCRIVGLWDMKGMTDDNHEKYIDYLFTKGRGILKLKGRKDGTTRKHIKH